MKWACLCFAVLLAVAVPLTVPPTAGADSIIVSLSSVTPLGPSDFLYTYSADLSNLEKLDLSHNAGFFTIYDFAGLIPGSQTASGGISGDFGFSSANLGQTPAFTVPPDDPSVPNLTWTYNSSSVVSGPLFLGLFGARSTMGTTHLSAFGAQATLISNNTTASNVGFVSTPVSGVASLTLVSLGGALAAAGLLRRRLPL